MKRKNISEEELKRTFDKIQIGHDNTIKPPKNMERDFSLYVNKMNSSGDVVIRNRNGYYRPFPLDDVDSSEFSKYIQKEYTRAMEVIDRCNAMTMAYQRIQNHINGILEETRKKWEEQQ